VWSLFLIVNVATDRYPGQDVACNSFYSTKEILDYLLSILRDTGDKLFVDLVPYVCGIAWSELKVLVEVKSSLAIWQMSDTNET